MAGTVKRQGSSLLCRELTSASGSSPLVSKNATLKIPCLSSGRFSKRILAVRLPTVRSKNLISGRCKIKDPSVSNIALISTDRLVVDFFITLPANVPPRVKMCSGVISEALKVAMFSLIKSRAF